MRVDLFLKASRLCKRRSVAKSLCDSGRVMIEGTPAKPAHTVKVGDEIDIRQGNLRQRIRVVEVPTSNVPKEYADKLYEVIASGQC